MHTRLLRWTVPAAVVVLVLSGCQLTTARGGGSVQQPENRQSSESVEDNLSLRYLHQERMRHLSEPVADNLSLGYLHRERMQQPAGR